MTREERIDFMTLWNMFALEVNTNAHNKGFYEKPEPVGTRLMLMVTELAEAMEAYRHGNPPDDKVPEFGGIETELADCVIRILDFAHENRLPVAQAMFAKAAYNTSRPYLHGKKC